jgi:hypothetical protein
VLSTALITAPSFDETVQNLRYLWQWLIRVESCGREKPLLVECKERARAEKPSFPQDELQRIDS